MKYVKIGSISTRTECQPVWFECICQGGYFSLEIIGVGKSRAGCTKSDSDITCFLGTNDQPAVFDESGVVLV